MRRNKILVLSLSLSIIVTTIILASTGMFNSFAKAKEIESFSNFILEFSHNQQFQKERIKFPIEYVYWDIDEDKQLKKEIPMDKYKFIELLLKNASNDVAFYTITPGFELSEGFNDYPDANKMVLKQWGLSDYQEIFYFERVKGEWYLLKIESNDPLG